MIGRLLTGVLGLASGLLSGTTANAQDTAPDFRSEILPILERSCFDCHQAPRRDADGRLRKPKGGLRLDGPSHFRAGGDNGAVLVAGQPDESPLYARTVLPPDDIDIMPEDGDPLSDAETALLRRWIDGGASFGDWQGSDAAGDQAERVAESIPLPSAQSRARAAEGLSPLAQSKLGKALGEHGRAEALDPERRLFRIHFAAHQDQVTDQTLKALTPVAEHVFTLDLRRTALTDRAVPDLLRFGRLHRLELGRTALTSKALAKLAQFEHLEDLVLVGTKGCDDAVLDALVEARPLRQLYVWGSSVTEQGLRRFATARPDVRVVAAPPLPPPPARDDDDAPPRRRR